MAHRASNKPIRVLIIDGNPVTRRLTRAALKQERGIEVVGHASDHDSAREAVMALNPDAVTLDLETPRMDGLSFLGRLMRRRPVPVIAIIARSAAMKAMETAARELGAAHCLFKPPPPWDTEMYAGLAAMIRDAAGVKSAAPAVRESGAEGFDPERIIVLGASTGGVDALASVLGAFPANCPPTLIVQHMPNRFISLFAHRLDSVCAPKVEVARGGEPLRSGRVLIAPSGRHMRLGKGDTNVVMLKDRPPVNGFRPAVDVLFHSAAEKLGPLAVGGLLTGMGRDGAAGLLALKKAGAVTVAQDAATSVVYGMPRAALELGAVDRALPLGKIARALLDPCRAEALRDAS